MKSRTSFFNGTVLKKDITRFAPVWALHTVFLLLSIFSIFSASKLLASISANNELTYSFSNIGSGMPLFLGFLCGTLLFGDLFKSRICNALHAMPLRRETWFATHYLAGLLFFIVPTTLAALIMAPMLKGNAFIAPLWWLIQVGSYLLFFSLAVCCAMCVGSRVGHATVFLLIAFLPVLAYGIYSNIYEPFLYGIRSDGTLAAMLSPGASFLDTDFFDWGTTTYGTFSYLYHGINPDGWIRLGCWVAVSFFLVFAALWLYKRRRLEWAGDFVNYEILRWILLVLGSFYAAIIIPVAGFIVGFFGLSMLLERTVKVFHKRNWVRFTILAVAALMTLGATYMDPLGVVNHIPNRDKIESVSVDSSYGYDATLLENPQDIQSAINLHEYALEERDIEDVEWTYSYSYSLTYNLKSGRKVNRVYWVDMRSTPVQELKKSLSSFEVLFGTDDLEALRRSIYSIQVNLNNEKQGTTPLYQWEQIPSDQFDKLFEAILEDCENGILAQDPSLHPSGPYAYDQLRIWYDSEAGGGSIDLNVYMGSKTYMLLK